MFEINLVPNVKGEMIKAQKTRNLVFFICLIVVGVVAGLILILGSIKGAQDITMSGQDAKIEKMSKEINGYEDLDEFLTIQDQLNKIAEIGDKKTVLSRVFGILNVLLPSGADKITLSELNVDLDKSTLAFDGQADAGEAPLIDYRVLEAFKKSMSLMRFDYGHYVDAEGNEIPTVCLAETDEKGRIYTENGNMYAIWYRGVKGCDPADKEAGATTIATRDTKKDEMIWRTPQFTEWFKTENMDLDGQIEGVAHFNSDCITYIGSDESGAVKWVTNNVCALVPDGTAVISESSNGKDASGKLVLKFSATIQLNEEAFAFRNKHMIAIAPTGRQNMTDSYIQIKDMFSEQASDCEEGDAACANTKNMTGE